MRRFTVLFLVLTLSVLAVVSVIAQGQSKTLVVGLSEDYHALDPSRAYEPGGSLIYHSVYNTLVTFQVTGRQLEQILLTNARAAEHDTHGILQVSGLRYAYRVDGDAVEVLEITVGGQPLDPARVYKVACPDYVAMQAAVYLDMARPRTTYVRSSITDVIVEAVEALL